MKSFYKRFGCLLIIAVLVLQMASLFVNQSAHAESFSWINGDLSGEVIGPADDGLDDPGKQLCTYQTVRFGGLSGEDRSICVYKAQGWTYGIAVGRTATGSWSVRDFAIGFSGESAMYKVEGISTAYAPVFVANSNNLVLSSHADGPMSTIHLSIIKNLPSRLERVVSSDLVPKTSYRLKEGSLEPLVRDEQNNYVRMQSFGVSENGEWMVVKLLTGGLIRINTKTFEKIWFSKSLSSQGFNNETNNQFSISDDGRHVATLSWGPAPQMSEVTRDCGRAIGVFQTSWSSTYLQEDINSCPVRNLESIVRQVFGSDFAYAWDPMFNFEGGELTVRAIAHHSSPNGGQAKWVKILASGYTPSSKLDYLALGDSYSSGEGDLGIDIFTNQKYYREHTDVMGTDTIPVEDCHLSTRSYPYLLKSYMNLSNNNWQSVACSGAMIADISPPNTDYKGQGDRLAKLSKSEKMMYSLTAINEFIPGRIQQLEFVKKYQPKALTLTMGGNDVGFQKVLDVCARDITSCPYTDDHNKLKRILGASIQGQFSKLKAIYADTVLASPNSKIYAVGYPRFVRDQFFGACQLNVGLLDPAERDMVDEATKYMNDNIEAAANASGIKYIDIEDSLIGGRLCESGDYVTGVTDVGADKRPNEMFHPNAKGHEQIAQSIKQSLGEGKTLLNYEHARVCDSQVSLVCTNSSITTPPPTDYFAAAMGTDGSLAKYQKMMEDPQVKNATTNLRIGEYQLGANKPVSVKGYSDPTDLGTYTTEADGSLDVNITFPNRMPAGFHTVVVSGETYSGEPINFYQVVEVQGSNPNDRDEDAIDDSVDPCMYLPAANVDQDADGIDDACDPEIGEPKVPYRIRGGVAEKGEQSNYLYIERNVHATALTGVSGDFDPDHDGWAVVGASQDAVQVGPYAKFWIDGVDGSKVPHVSLRTAESGCVQYKPASLAKVTDASVRIFAQEAADTNTCRFEPATADLDNNGQPDNTQPLYRARNGDLSKGESATKLYLERSTRAAEAQLGKSDYATNTAVPTSLTDTTDYRQTWSLLAATHNFWEWPLSSNYRRLIFANSQPYVVTAGVSNAANICYAYKPESLATIKQSTQPTRSLQLDMMQTVTMLLRKECN